ncbi:MAG: CotH kinase family protein, partial [Verrucomicrobiales bacterium]|nr:CotH kinase family protein [Verrucomicrobiales bacterium]
EDTLNDEDGDASDWIEIENASDQAVDLTGWALTDDPTRTSRWRFAGVDLDARSRLVVFASGKNRPGPTGELHADFRLGRAGGYLALLRPDGGVASEFGPGYPAQREDVSYGRLPTDPLATGYFETPTPGGPNAEGGPGFAPEVAFSRIGGTFLEAFDLVLRPKDGPAVVRYTVDGSVPTERSPEASGPLRVASSMRVRARAFVAGLLPGPLGAEYYVQLSPSAAAASTLPMVLIHSFGGGGVPSDGEYPAFVSLYEPRGGFASLTNAPDLRSRARLNIRGSSTLFQEKRNYSVEFRDEREADRDLSPLGLPSDSDWILYAPNNFEPILIHNPLIFHVSRSICRYAPRTRFAEVYVQTGTGAVASQHYAGIYVLMERIKRGPDRVDMAELQPEHTKAPRVTGGYLLKVDRLDPGDSGLVAGGQLMGFVDPKEEEMRSPRRAPQLSYIRDYIDRFGQALNGANWRDPSTGWRAYVDEGAWIDHHLLNVVAFNVDALRLSAYFHKPREGKLTFGPIWDFDRALNSTDGRDSNPRIWRSATSDRGTDFFNYTWWGRLFSDPDFWQRYIDRYQELRRGAFETNALFRLIDDMTGQVRAAQPREAARWPGFTTPRGSYSNEIASLKSWLFRRIHFMDTNFLAAPTAAIASGAPGRPWLVTLSGPTGATLRYTTDGSDPRAPGGAISPSSKVYSGPIPLGDTDFVRVRAHDLSHRNLTGPNN